MTLIRKKHILLCGLIGIFILFSGCTSPTPSGTVDNRFVGTWTSDSFLGSTINFEFNSDKTVAVTGDVTRSGTWTTDGNTLTMHFNDETGGITLSGSFEFEFSSSDTVLQLTYGAVVLTLNKV